MSGKYTAIGWAAAAGLYVLIYSLRTGFNTIIRNSLFYIGAASLVLLPWLARNWAFYNNPIYPFGPPTGEWDALSNEWYNNPADAMFQQYPAWWATFPLSSTLLGIENAPGFSATIGP